MRLEQQVKEILEKPEVFELIGQCATKVNGAGFLVYYTDGTIFPGQIVDGKELNVEEALSRSAKADALDKARGEYKEEPLGPARFRMLLWDARQELDAYVNTYLAQNYPKINPRRGVLLLTKWRLIRTTEEIRAELSDLISEGGEKIHSSLLVHNADGISLAQLNYLRGAFPNVMLVEGRFFSDSCEGNILLYQQLKLISKAALRMEIIGEMFNGVSSLPERSKEVTTFYRKTEGILDLQSRILLM